MYRRFIGIVQVCKWPLLVLFAGLTLFLGSRIPNLQIDPSIETLFNKTSDEYRYYRAYREKYGSDQMISVAVDTLEVFDRGNLLRLWELTKKIGQFPQVERVMSLANAGDIQHKMFGVKIVPLIDGALKGEESFADLRKKVLTNELFVRNLVSTTGKVANLVVSLKPESRDRASNGKFIKDLRLLLKSYEGPGMKSYVAGTPVEQYDFIRLIQHDQMILVPLIVVLLVLALYVVYRSLACTLLAMMIVLVTLVWTFGTIALLKQELNLVTSLLAPVIMIIAVVNAIHVMHLFLDIRYHHASVRETVTLTMDQLAVPCFLTHVATMLGFASLVFTRVPGIQSFGVFAALGAFYSYVVVTVLTPLILPFLPYRRLHADDPEGHFFNRILIGFLERLGFGWKWLIFFCAALVVWGSVRGIGRLQADMNIVKQMKSDSELAQATRFIDANLTGVYSLGFVVRKKNGQSFVDAESLRRIEAFQKFLEAMPEIPKVNSLIAVIKKINEAREDSREGYVIPDDRKTLSRYFRGLAESGDPQLWNFVSRDFTEIRLEARMKAVETGAAARVEALAKKYIDEKLGRDFDCRMAGDVVLLGRMARDLPRNQIRSFGFAFASIFLLIVLVFRSLKMGLLAAIPNLLPVLAVYGLMGYAGVKLSLPTAMVSSIVLGMVVDASIHFLYRFRHEFKQRRHYMAALHHTFRNVGQALTVSALILGTGFAASVLASFKPTVYFGILTSLTILLALFCTLVVLPVCLVILKPFGPHRLFSQKPSGPGALPDANR